VPKLTFPGGALIGCAAGFINLPRIKGSHKRILSGMMAAELAAAAVVAGAAATSLPITTARGASRRSARDLHKVRNVKPFWSKLGTTIGFAFAGLDMWTNTLGFSLFGTLRHGKRIRRPCSRPRSSKPIVYPRPDGKVSFDKLLLGVSVEHQSRGRPNRCTSS